MKVNEKIRILREHKHWSQEDIAHKLNISANAYSKIERGETRLNLPRLEQLAEIFEMDIIELLQTDVPQYHVGNYNNNSEISFYANVPNDFTSEIEKLRQVIHHQQELLDTKELFIKQQNRELETLKELIELLKLQIQK